MIKGTLRFVVFCVIVLLLGQIKLSGNTIGAHVQQKTTSAAIWAAEKLVTYKWIKKAGVDRVIAQWLEHDAPTPVHRIEAGLKKSGKSSEHHEHISKEDQKRIRSLLE